MLNFLKLLLTVRLSNSKELFTKRSKQTQDKLNYYLNLLLNKHKIEHLRAVILDRPLLSRKLKVILHSRIMPTCKNKTMPVLTLHLITLLIVKLKRIICNRPGNSVNKCKMLKWRTRKEDIRSSCLSLELEQTRKLFRLKKTLSAITYRKDLRWRSPLSQSLLKSKIRTLTTFKISNKHQSLQSNSNNLSSRRGKLTRKMWNLSLYRRLIKRKRRLRKL